MQLGVHQISYDLPERVRECACLFFLVKCACQRERICILATVFIRYSESDDVFIINVIIILRYSTSSFFVSLPKLKALQSEYVYGVVLGFLKPQNCSYKL